MEQVFSTSRRGISARSIFIFATTVLMTALLWATFGSHLTTHAAGPTANWKGTDSITYDGHQYNANSKAAKNNTLGLPEGTVYYTYVPDSDGTTGTAAKSVKAMVIYFSSGVDPPKATTAQFATYDYTPSKGYSNQSDKKSIDITPQGDSTAYRSSCSVDGIGWIICPATTYLASGMDFVFSVVAKFMAVQPVTVGDTTSSLYTAWNIMRTIANVAFIIVFLIIIYSQLTSAAVSNYGIKKLLPRLIIASVLVNLSYFICSLAVDVSNILGYSLQEVFIQIRQNTFNLTNDTWSASTTAWTTVTALVLSGAGIGALAANPEVIFLLVPLLIGLLVTILFVLLILAARQAIIVILIILAPLAFVAYLLPNTEQWFKKWRDLFMTMLIFFPAFSLVFGGSQLAGGIIIQNATSILMVVIGLAVQVAPLVITPIILKFSGGVLGRIAGLVNNPRKGIVDRSKNWANKRVERGKQAALANPNSKNPFRKVSQRLAYGDRNVDKSTEKYKAQSEDWMSKRDISTRRGQETEIATNLAKLSTEESHHEMGRAMEELRAGNADSLGRLRLKVDPSMAERARERLTGKSIADQRAPQAASYEITYDEDGKVVMPDKKDANYKFNLVAAKAIGDAQHLDQESRVVEMATAIAKNKQLTNYAKAVENDAHDIRIRAGGIGGEVGQQGALAAAFKAQAGAHNDAVANAASIMNRYNYTDDVVGKIALSELGYKPEGVAFPVTAALKEAAILKIASGGNGGELQRLLENIQIDDTEATQDFRQAFADAVIKNSARPKYAGAGYIADIKRGKTADGNPIPPAGPGRIEQYVIGSINQDKFGSADVLVTQDRDYIDKLASIIAKPEARSQMDASHKAKILRAIDTIRADPIYSGKVGERAKSIDNIEEILLREPDVVNLRNKANEAGQERDKELHGDD